MEVKDTNKNALADLAERLYTICMHTSRSNGLDEIAKAQRIIAELAKVEVYTGCITGTKHIGAGLAERFIKCHKIAEEGAKDAN